MGVVNQIKDLDNSSKPLPYKSAVTFTVGEGCSPLGRRHEVTVGDSPDRGNVREADKKGCRSRLEKGVSAEECSSRYVS